MCFFGVSGAADMGYDDETREGCGEEGYGWWSRKRDDVRKFVTRDLAN